MSLFLKVIKTEIHFGCEETPGRILVSQQHLVSSGDEIPGGGGGGGGLPYK